VRLLAFAIVVVVAFAAGLMVSFPTGRVVDAALARLPPRAAAAVERVGTSYLSLGGLTLDDVTLRPYPEAPPLEVRSLSLRPSLLGLLRGRQGWPWHVTVRTCDGTARGEADRAVDDGTIRLRFEALDLVPCLAPLEPRGAIEGRASGDAALALAPGGTTGSGTVTLAAARWLAEGMPAHLALRADQATIRWRLDGALHLDDFTLSNDEYTATGSGLVRLQPPPAAPEIDLRVRVQPARTMPQAHRDLLSKLPGSPPDATGARTYRIAGPLDAPVLGVP
jgi:type II secretion system protein N